MPLKKAYMYDAYHNKIRHTYINPDDAEGISWVISTEKYQTLLTIIINGSTYLVIGNNKSSDINGIMIKYEEKYYRFFGNILFLCITEDRMAVKDAEITEKDLSNISKIIQSHD